MKKNIVITCIIWVLLVSASFLWNYYSAMSEQKEIALQTARSFFKQVLITRRWNARHGGVYVPVTAETPSNPYLIGPDRDIRVSDTLTLTKINPAYMTRQISEIAAEGEGIQFHITSRRPIRPENRPGPDEERALIAFEKGEKEVGQIIRTGANSTFFYMAPLITEKVCLGCHENQGYREGDIRGGISVTVPFIPKMPLWTLLIGHLVIGLAGLAGILYFGVRLDKAYESIKRDAAFDSLTGIFNRRTFSDRAMKEFKLSRREKYFLSVIMADIDNFKDYNDTYGHAAGDECLQKVAQVIAGTLKRPSDFCARYGGEEFIVVLPNTPLEGARKLAEKIRENILKMSIPHERSTHNGILSLSLGVASTDIGLEMSHEELLKQADRALYAAKEKGRNRVEVSDSVIMA